MMIVSGLDKKIETVILEKYDIPSIETNVINFLSSKKTPMNNTLTTPTVGDTSHLKKAYFAG